LGRRFDDIRRRVPPSPGTGERRPRCRLGRFGLSYGWKPSHDTGDLCRLMVSLPEQNSASTPHSGPNCGIFTLFGACRGTYPGRDHPAGCANRCSGADNTRGGSHPRTA
jgi:hypothetical protein